MAEQPTNKGAQGDLIPIATAARLLEIGEERLRQLKKDGYVDFPKRGYTTLVSAVRGYIRFLKDAAAKETKTAAVSRAQNARAQEVELRLQERRRDLIPQREAALAMSLLVETVVDEFNGLPKRVTRDVEQLRVIEDETHGAKRRIADRLDQLSGALADGSVADQAGG